MNSHGGNLRILHTNSMGYVARCTCCNEVQVSIGNLITHMDLENFKRFHTSLQNVAENIEQYHMPCPDGDRILIRTPVKNLHLTFSINQFAETMEMMAQASVLLEAGEIITPRD